MVVAIINYDDFLDNNNNYNVMIVLVVVMMMIMGVNNDKNESTDNINSVYRDT